VAKSQLIAEPGIIVRYGSKILYRIIKTNQINEVSMKFKLIPIAFFLGLILVQNSNAANITNNITGVGPKDAPVYPYLCVQNSAGVVPTAGVLAHNQTANGNAISGSEDYVGATLRFGGCSDSNTYLGYAEFNINEQHNNKFSSYASPLGVHIIYADGAVDSNGVVTGKIKYTNINPNFELLTTTPSSNPNWLFVGANLSGLEFGKTVDPVVIPNLSVEDSSGTYTDLKDTQSFLKSGMNTMRVPLSWGYLQLDGAGKGAINLDYYDSYVKPLLETLTSAKVYTIVDLHAYMRYSKFGKEYSGCSDDPTAKCPDGTLITDPAAYKDIWTKLYAEMKKDPKINMDYILLDLVNEPVDAPNDSVFVIQAETIKALRDKGFNGYILVEGNSWSGLHSWTDESWKSSDGKTSYTNASLFSRDNFVKSGITDLSKIIINAHQYLDSNYSGTHADCLTDLTTTGSGKFNLNAFVDYLQTNNLKAMVTEFGSGSNSASCKIALTKFLDYLKDNTAKDGKDYGFIGWTIWSTGHGWGNYELRVTPTSYHMDVMKNYLQAM